MPLGYAALSRALARSIAGAVPQDGIVLAINGPWGSGKTSAANMVVDALTELQKDDLEESKVIPVRFNPWWFSGQDDLVRAFFGEVSAALGTRVSDKVIAGLKAVARRASGAKDLVLAGIDFVPGGSLMKAVAGGVIGVAGKLADDDGSLTQEREKLSVALRESGRRILVVTDDIDRLPADEARQIFRLVKSVADLPNVIHLLVFDRETARRALGEPADVDSPEWLEKIVQAPFDLPPVHPVDLHNLFFTGLNRIVASYTLPDRTRWGNMFHDAVAPWLRTPRDSGRLLNALAVSWPAVAGDVDLADFVTLETMRVFEPGLHAFVRRNPELLTGLQSERREVDPDLGDELLSVVSGPRRDQARAALQRLFPRLRAVWSKHNYSSDFLEKWDRERRACSPGRFPAYFTFGVGDDALPRAELDPFMAGISNPAMVREIVSRYASIPRRAGGTKAAVLLSELSTHVEQISLDDIPAAVVNLLGVADLFANPADERGNNFLDFPAVWHVWWTVQAMLKRLGDDARADALRRAVREAPALLGISFALNVLSDQHGREPESKPDPDRERLVDEAVLDELEVGLRTRFRDAAEDGSLLAQPGLIEMLFRWARLSCEAEVQTWTGELLTEDTHILRLAKAATQMSRAVVSGDRVGREVPRVHRSSLERLVNVDRLIERLDAIAAVGDAEAKGITARFHAGLADPF